MNLHQLRVFFHVAQCLSFSKASEELHISQPAVSVQVRKLEEEIGVELIEQIGKKLYLTDPGLQLQRYAENIFSAEREAETMLSEFRGLNTGRLVVGASTALGTYFVPSLLAEFRQAFPKLDVTLKIGNTDWVEEQVSRNAVDMALVVDEHAEIPELTSMPFLNDELVVIAAPNHPLVGKEILVKDLAGQPFFIREPGSNTRKVFKNAMSQLDIPFRTLMELESTEAIKRLVSSGVGLGVASKLTLEWEVGCERLAILDIADLQMERQFSLTWHKDKKPNRAAQAFIDFVCRYASSHQDYLKDCECTRRRSVNRSSKE